MNLLCSIGLHRCRSWEKKTEYFVRYPTSSEVAYKGWEGHEKIQYSVEFQETKCIKCGKFFRESLEHE